MVLGGVPIDDRLVRRLAAHVGSPLGSKLDHALLFRAQIVALTRNEKEAILAALESAPHELDELRELLRADENWSLRRRL